MAKAELMPNSLRLFAEPEEAEETAIKMFAKGYDFKTVQRMTGFSKSICKKAQERHRNGKKRETKP